MCREYFNNNQSERASAKSHTSEQRRSLLLGAKCVTQRQRFLAVSPRSAFYTGAPPRRAIEREEKCVFAGRDSGEEELTSEMERLVCSVRTCGGRTRGCGAIDFFGAFSDERARDLRFERTNRSAKGKSRKLKCVRRRVRG